MTQLTRVNPSAEVVINWCPGQLKNYQLMKKIIITDEPSEKCKRYVQCRWIKTEVICFIFVNPQGIISCGLTELIYTESLIITYLSRLIATLSSSSSSSLYLPFSTTQII